MARLLAAAALLALVAAAAAPARADGPPPPGPRISAPYCSPSGDICFGIVLRRGALSLELTAMERYFDRYRLCVRAPDGASTCRAFPLARRGAVHGSAVRWSASFPSRGRGSYEVRWLLGREPLGPPLRFTLPLRR